MRSAPAPFAIAYPFARIAKPIPLRTASLLVSIVMPVKNGMPWLPLAVQSLLRQMGPVQLVVCDGGSTDGSREWLREHAGGRVELAFEPDSGQPEAIARGFDRADGEILGWLNADDILCDGALEAVRTAFDDHPSASMVSGGCELIDDAGQVNGRIPVPPDGSRTGLLRHPTNLAQPATLFRAAAYRQCGGVDQDLHLAMDVDLWLKLALHGDAVLLPDQVLAQFRIHASAKSSRAAVRMIREDLRVRLRHGLSPLSATALTLARAAYISPLKGRLKSAVRSPFPD